jgi:hypothetical protein
MSLMTILVYGVGAILYFGFLIVIYKRWGENESFRDINKFSLNKFKKKYFFWDAADRMRKSLFAILQVFFEPVLLMTLGIFIIFIALMLQFHLIPYKKKFQYFSNFL